MIDQKSLSLTPSNLEVPEKWQERYFIKRINEDDIEISLEERNGILKALEAGVRFVQIGKYTLMLNSIKSIDPKWGKDNIPPRPKLKERIDYEYDSQGKIYKALLTVTNKEELEEYNKIFGEKGMLPSELLALTDGDKHDDQQDDDMPF